MKTVISPGLLFLLVCGALRADVSPAPLFCDGAVLQRGKPVPVWGTAAPGEKVSVAFAGGAVSTVAGADGQWCAVLPAMPASGEPRDLIISGNNRIDIKNVVVGEVWLASGQSNMERILRRTYSGGFETAAAIHPPVRHFKVAWKVSHVPLGEAGGKWEEASAATVGEFTAVGYHFAGDLYRALGVPVGIINSSWGGTRIEAWMDREASGASNGAEFALIYERWREVLKNYPAARAKYEFARAAWEKERDAAAENGGAFSRRPPPPPPGPGHQDTPGGLYNGMIHPLVPYAIKGVLWYQGESNVGRADEYHAFFSALIQGWRRAFGQGEFPFYWVQLANYKYNGADNPGYALLREAQAKTLALPRTGQAVTIDIGDVNDIHPLNKREVGARLARLALARDYGLAAIADSGPEFLRAGRERDGMRVFFKPSKSPLASPRGVRPAGFELAGADGVWHPATARIEGGTIFAGSPAAPRPAAVRYAWKNAPEAGLFNEAGLPAAPFRAVVPPDGEAPAAELAARLRHYSDGQIMAGAVLLVADAKSGRVLAREALGRADIAAARPMRADDVFWVASMTKPVTAAAFMMLVDEGRAGLDDPVENYIPGFNNNNLKVVKPGGPPAAPSAVIRIRHLLSHTAGLRFINTTDKGLIDSVPLKTSVEHVLLDPLEHEPGEKFLYSNASIDAAGRIIEIVSGMPYEKFLEERLFKPLGMADTTFTPAPGQLRRLAKTYRAASDGKALAETRTGYLTYPLDAPGRHPSPSGGLFSTAGDMLRFCLMLANGGVLDGRRYLSEEAVRQMTMKQTGPLVAKDYGLGLGGSPDGRTFGHGGSLKTDMMVENGQIRIFLSQHSGNWSTGDPIADFAKEARRLFPSAVENTIH